jgi:hypothetical protein
MPVPGATSASLTTAALQLADSADKFTVTVTNAYGSVTSNVATVTIGPRAPAQRDMRFKHVQLAPPWRGSRPPASSQRFRETYLRILSPARSVRP